MVEIESNLDILSHHDATNKKFNPTFHEDKQEGIKSNHISLKKSSSQHFNEDFSDSTMLLQRPCFKSQSVSHILARTFRDMFSYDVMKSGMIDNLYRSCAPSNNSSDDYHRQYVNGLRHIQEMHERRMAEADMVEQHILEAQTRALMEERAHEENILNNNNYDPNIYIPPVPCYFKHHCNGELLQKYDLIYAQDFMTQDIPPIKFPDIISSNNLVAPSSYSNKTEEIKRSNVSVIKWKLKNENKNNRNSYESSQTLNLLNKSSVIKKDKSIISLNSSEFFITKPTEIIFTNYEIGKVYQMPLELKNVSSSLKFLRVIPPTSTYFSINFGRFPSSRGSIASGLSCIYWIQFCPDSLMDYDDFIVVEPEGSKPFCVEVKAKRLPPHLNLDETIDIGDCLVGSRKWIHLKICNFGGDGSFGIVPLEHWPTTDLQDIIVDNRVMLGDCMEVQPACFDVKRSSSIELDILFAPKQHMDYQQVFVLTCDNCTTQHVTIQGCARLSKVSLECGVDDLSDYEIGEIPDTGAQYLMRFEPVNVQAIATKNFTIKNCIDVDMEFVWRIFRAHKSKGVFEDEIITDKLPVERLEDKEASFCVEPCKGKIDASSSFKFTLTFQPQKKDEYCNLFCLNLKFTKYLEDQTTENVEVPGLAIEVIGSTTDGYTIIEPNIFIIQKLIPIFCPEKRSFKIINKSESEINYEWNTKSFPFYLSVEPQSGKIGGNSFLNFEFTLRSERATRVKEILPCMIGGDVTSLGIYIDAQFQGPELRLCEPDVCFDSLELNKTITAKLKFKNISSVPAMWKLYPANTEEELDLSEFEMSYCGYIGAYEFTN